MPFLTLVWGRVPLKKTTERREPGFRTLVERFDTDSGEITEANAPRRYVSLVSRRGSEVLDTLRATRKAKPAENAVEGSKRGELTTPDLSPPPEKWNGGFHLWFHFTLMGNALMVGGIPTCFSNSPASYAFWTNKSHVSPAPGAGEL